MSFNQSDLQLLRSYEPVLRFTKGEKFFPMAVEPYIRECSLWVRRPNQKPVCLIPPGQMTLEALAGPRTLGFGAVYYLKFIEPLNLTELAAYRLQQGLTRRDPMKTFHAGSGRLARVGYGSRLLDAGFSLTLFARGRLPGDTAAAAALLYEKLMEEAELYCYYGRVKRMNGWLVLQYWFFYPFNDWRTGFFGANDHEADWEMISIYLSESAQGDHRPEWVAYASHDFYGDDLRRRWDDPELVKIGRHPVVYVGAGSHASYFAPGEYLSEFELPLLTPMATAWQRIRQFSKQAFGQTPVESAQSQGHQQHLFRIPFVDYARGDGIGIGAEQELQWSKPKLIDPPPDWALRYRGLWGRYVQDPQAGEIAPAGPLYNRDGSVRMSWSDPVAWAGLDKITPRAKATELVSQRQAELKQEIEHLENEIEGGNRRIATLGIDMLAMQGVPHLADQYARHSEELAALSAQVAEFRNRLSEERAMLEALAHYEGQIQTGEIGHPRSHLQRAMMPASDTELRLGRIAEFWAAISTGLMTIGFVSIVLFFRDYLVLGLVALLSLIIFLEASFRRQLVSLVSSVTIGLAIVSGLVLLFQFFWDIVIALTVVVSAYIMWENLRELRG